MNRLSMVNCNLVRPCLLNYYGCLTLKQDEFSLSSTVESEGILSSQEHYRLALTCLFRADSGKIVK